jgi:phospholipase C
MSFRRPAAPPLLLLAPLLLLLLSSASAQTTNTHERLQRIKHVVVLCLENRSFDHMFGFLNHTRDIDNLRDKPFLYNAVNVSDPASPRVYVGPGARYVDPQDPGHYVSMVSEQIYGTRNVPRPYPNPAPMNGFLQNNNGVFKSLAAARSTIKSFRPAEIPVLTRLAEEYAVFDRWFSSVPGPTQPNRAFLHSATANGEINNQRWHMRLGYPQKTIFQSLHEAKKDFAVFYHDGPTPGLFRWMRRPDILVGKMHSYEGHLGGLIGGFKKRVRDGKLPEYTFIDPRYFDRKGNFLIKSKYANDDHPPHDVRRGQSLVKDVYETLRAGPHWSSTLLIITYDEHGGYYDHVPPPSRGVPNPDGKVGDGAMFDRLGVRVPTVMISPWIRKGAVIHRPRPESRPTPTSQFEHSSVPATIKKLFGLPNFLTRRDAWAGTFEEVWQELDTMRTDCPMSIPNHPVTTQPALAARADVEHAPDGSIDESGPLTDMQAALVEVVQGIKRAPMTPAEAMEQVGDDGGNTDLSKDQARQLVHQGLAEARGEWF